MECEHVIVSFIHNRDILHKIEVWNIQPVLMIADSTYMFTDYTFIKISMITNGNNQATGFHYLTTCPANLVLPKI